MSEANGGIPTKCECGAAWVYRAPWWARPAADPEWGYLVHCERGHFRWFAAELSAEELAGARERFAVDREGGV